MCVCGVKRVRVVLVCFFGGDTYTYTLVVAVKMAAVSVAVTATRVVPSGKTVSLAGR